jgi:hypothetical protein
MLNEIEKDKDWLKNIDINSPFTTKNIDFYITQKLNNFESLSNNE